MQDLGDLDDIIGLCSDNEMEESVEEESKRKSYDELEIGRIIQKEQSPFFIPDHGRKI